MPQISALRPDAIWCGRAPHAYIGQRLSLTQDVLQSQLQCAGSGPFRLYVNGLFAGRGLGPALTQQAMWEDFDITALLQPGDNAIVVLAAAGELPWFRVRGGVQYQDGQGIDLLSGTPWRTRPADAWQIEGGDAVSYRAADEVWSGGKDLSVGWRDADLVRDAPPPQDWDPRRVHEREIWARLEGFGEVDAAGALQPTPHPRPMRACKCVHREALLTPGKAQALVQTRQEDRAVYLALDLGRIAYGVPRIRLRGHKGCVIDLGFGVDPSAIASHMRYICKDGWQEWDGLYPQGCRYLWVRIAQCPEVVEVDCISLVERVFPVAAQTYVEGPKEWGSLWESSRQALDAVRQEVYLPALGVKPQAFDWLRAYALALDGYYAYGDTQTAAATLDSTPVPTDNQRWPHLLFLESYAHYAGCDRRVKDLAARALPALAADPDEGLVASAVDRVLWVAALDAAANLCRMLGQRQEAGALEGRRPTARRQLRTALKSAAETGMARNLALFFGLVDCSEAGQVRTKTGDLLEAFFATGALWACGQGDKALASLDLHWGRVAGRPGLTWTEKCKDATGKIWPGVAYHLGAGLFGVKPLQPGYAALSLAPACTVVPSAKGRIPVGEGHVDLRWRRGDGLEIGVQLTGPVEAHLSVPRLDRRFPTIGLNGDTIWRNEKVYPNAHVRQIMALPKEVIVVLPGPGDYTIDME